MSQPPNAEFQHAAGGVMLRVPPGSFIMGSPESEDGHCILERQREIHLPKPFYLGRTPITQAQYEAITGANPTDHEVNPAAPMDSVSWDQANEYCERLTTLDREAERLPANWEYRLPTEAEWEYACRAGGAEPRHGPPEDIAWYHENANYQPRAVGQKAPNAWGFHDMLGNIWEWCQDWYWVANPARSVRGGSYFNSARFCRSAQRCGWGFAGRYCGFRVLASESGSFTLSPPIDEFSTTDRPPSLFAALNASDFDLALQIIKADPLALESVDSIPPSLHGCVYDNQPKQLAWLLDQGADIELREQDYGGTPLDGAVVHRQKEIIRLLVERGADTTRAVELAQRGLAGGFEYDARLDREGYREIIELLRELGVNGKS